MTNTRPRHTTAVPNLDSAVTKMRDSGLRLSSARRVVLAALYAADGPLSAEQIADGDRGSRSRFGRRLGLSQPRDTRAPRDRPPRSPRSRAGSLRDRRPRRAGIPHLRAVRRLPRCATRARWTRSVGRSEPKFGYGPASRTFRSSGCARRARRCRDEAPAVGSHFCRAPHACWVWPSSSSGCTSSGSSSCLRSSRRTATRSGRRERSRWASGLRRTRSGMRHAFDADHISAIDNTTRKLMADGERPLSVGFFFSLGHSTIVFLLAFLFAVGIKALSGPVQHGGSDPARRDQLDRHRRLGHVPVRHRRHQRRDPVADRHRVP